MKKVLLFVLGVVIILFIIIQFFQPQKNIGEINSNHIFNQEQLPENIKSILTSACIDCHSNQTNYLWYHHIAPVSWMVDKHVKNGKNELNFSEWGKMDVFDKIKILEEICRETERKTMPLKPYPLMHKKARLTSEQIIEICNWSETLGEEILKKAIQ